MLPPTDRLPFALPHMSPLSTITSPSAAMPAPLVCEDLRVFQLNEFARSYAPGPVPVVVCHVEVLDAVADKSSFAVDAAIASLQAATKFATSSRLSGSTQRPTRSPQDFFSAMCSSRSSPRTSSLRANFCRSVSFWLRSFRSSESPRSRWKAVAPFSKSCLCQS